MTGWLTYTHTHIYTHTPHMALFAHFVPFRKVSIKCLSCLPKSILAGSQLKSLSRIVIYMISNFQFSATILYQGSRILPLGLCSMGIQLRNSREFPQRLVGFSLHGPLSASRFPWCPQVTFAAPSSWAACLLPGEAPCFCLSLPVLLLEKKKNGPKGNICVPGLLPCLLWLKHCSHPHFGCCW